MSFPKNLCLIIFCIFSLVVSGFIVCGYAQKELETIPPSEISLSIRGTYVPYRSTLAIYNEGRVTYSEEEGAGSGKKIIKKVGKISEEEFKELTRTIYNNNFFSLKKLYDNLQILDGSYTTVTVKINNQTYSVEDYCDAGPKSFHNIVDKLLEIKERSNLQISVN